MSQPKITSFFTITPKGNDSDKKSADSNVLMKKSISNVESMKTPSIHVKKETSDLRKLKPKQLEEEDSILLREYTIGSNKKLEIRQGDLTKERVEAIVNAANGALQHGGGVACAISKAGGGIIQKESYEWIKKYGYIETGEVGVTSGGNMFAKYVIHAVGPVYKGGNRNEPELLSRAVWNSLKKADELGVTSIALPAISSGIYGFPKDKCANIMITTVIKFFEETLDTSLVTVRLTNWDEVTYTVFEKTFDTIIQNYSIKV